MNIFIGIIIIVLLAFIAYKVSQAKKFPTDNSGVGGGIDNGGNGGSGDAGNPPEDIPPQ